MLLCKEIYGPGIEPGHLCYAGKPSRKRAKTH